MTPTEALALLEANPMNSTLMGDAYPALLACARFLERFIAADGDDGTDDGGCAAQYTGRHNPACFVGQAEVVLAALAASVEGGK